MHFNRIVYSSHLLTKKLTNILLTSSIKLMERYNLMQNFPNPVINHLLTEYQPNNIMNSKAPTLLKHFISNYQVSKIKVNEKVGNHKLQYKLIIEEFLLKIVMIASNHFCNKMRRTTQTKIILKKVSIPLEIAAKMIVSMK